MTTIADIPYFKTSVSSLEAFLFDEPTGPFKGLFNPSRQLELVSGGGAHARVAGRRHGAVQFNNGDFFRSPVNTSWNALDSAAERWLGVRVVFKHSPSVATTFGLGVTHASDTAKNQYGLDLSVSNGIQLFCPVDGGGNDPYIDSNASLALNQWHEMIAQMYYDGSGTGTSLDLWVDGVNYTTISGNVAVTPGWLGDYFRFGAGLASSASNITMGELVLWTSPTVKMGASDAAALWNGGAGIPFTGLGGGGANRGRGRGRARFLTI